MPLTILCILGAALTAYHVLNAMAGARAAGWRKLKKDHDRQVRVLLEE